MISIRALVLSLLVSSMLSKLTANFSAIYIMNLEMEGAKTVADPSTWLSRPICKIIAFAFKALGWI